MTTKAKILIICTALLSVFSGMARTHPHIFITQRVHIFFDEKGLAGFKNQWIFDDMFASMIAGDYDKNQNGSFEKHEVAMIEKEAFAYLSNFNYFTFVKIDGKPFKVEFTKDFSATLLEDKKMVYEFTIPCHVTATQMPKHITVATYDPSYYSAIAFAKTDAISCANPNGFRVDTTVKEDTSTSIYNNQVHPWALFLEFSKAK